MPLYGISLSFSVLHTIFFHNVPLAEEIAQDVFVRLYQDYPNIKRASHLVFSHLMFVVKKIPLERI